jgi:Flp pilus assembly protein TadD
MGVRVGRVIVAAACLLWLAGCQTVAKLTDSLGPPLEPAVEAQASAAAPDPEPVGSTGKPDGKPDDKLKVTPQLLGADPNDDLNIGKKYFRQGAYGSAERHFRKAVEQQPRDVESWIGLAASYDRLRRFDLADRAYAQATRIVGPTPEILNNRGFSYMLRGDYRRARATLLAAKDKDPANPYVHNNLKMLKESARKAKAVNATR